MRSRSEPGARPTPMMLQLRDPSTWLRTSRSRLMERCDSTAKNVTTDGLQPKESIISSTICISLWRPTTAMLMSSSMFNSARLARTMDSCSHTRRKKRELESCLLSISSESLLIPQSCPREELLRSQCRRRSATITDQTSAMLARLGNAMSLHLRLWRHRSTLMRSTQKLVSLSWDGLD